MAASPASRTALMVIAVVAVAAVVASLLTLPLVPASARTAAPRLATVNGCWQHDNGSPVISSTTLSESTVDVSDSDAVVHVTVHAHDTGGPGRPTGIASVKVVLRPSDPELPLYVATMTRAAPHVWEGDAHVRQGAPAGAYQIETSVRDGADLERGRTSTTTLQVVDTGTPDDSTPPTVSDVSISPRSVDTTHSSATVTFTATIRDDGSGVAEAQVMITHATVLRAQDVRLTRVPGTDTWTGALTVPTWEGIGSVDYGLIEASDLAGNRLDLDLEKAGVADRVHIVSRARYKASGLARVLAHPRVVDIRRRSRTIPVRFRLSDPHGVTGATLSADYTVRPRALHLVSGTARDGVWAGRVKVPFCRTTPGRLHGDLVIENVEQSSRTTHPFLGRVREADHTPPGEGTVALHAGVTAYKFDEPVHGISSSGVVVVGVVTHAVVPGTWKCRDARSRRTSCRTGSVIRATFWQSQKPYVSLVDAIWEPDHHLDVVDRNGNPTHHSDSIGPDGV